MIGVEKPGNNQYDEKRNATGNNIIMFSEKEAPENQGHSRSNTQNHDKSLT